jgi:hypothetical protein
MNTAKHPKPLCVLVLGMHRSGTSALTRCLNLLGMDLGPHLLSPEKMNAKGFWEHADAVRINDTLLHAYGTYWHSLDPLPAGWLQGEVAAAAKEKIKALIQRDFTDVPLWGLKDPRMCRLAPLWLEVLQDMQIPTVAVFMTRSPLEVAASLERAHGLSSTFGLVSWMQHLAESEVATREITRTMVDYDRLLADPLSVLTSIGNTLHISWPLSVEDRGDAIHSFLDSGLRTHRSKVVSEDMPLIIGRMVGACESIIAEDGRRDSWSKLSQLSDEALEFTDLLGIMDGIEKDGGLPDDKVYATLYYAPDDEPFSEMRATSLELPFGRSQLDFILPDTSHTPYRFRLDPSDKRGYYVLHALVLLDSTGRVIWDWAEASSQVQSIGLEQATVGQAVQRELLRTADDSQMILQWPDTLSLKDAMLRLDIERITDGQLIEELEGAQDSSLKRNEQLIEKLDNAELRYINMMAEHAKHEVMYAEKLRDTESKYLSLLAEQTRKDMSHAEELRDMENRHTKEFKNMESLHASELAAYEERLERLNAQHGDSLTILESSYGEEIDRLTVKQMEQAMELEALRKSLVRRIFMRLRTIVPGRMRKSLRSAQTRHS